jgi:hypothetical protein
MSIQVNKYELVLDSSQHPTLNRHQFNALIDEERNKFCNGLAAKQCEFLALPDFNAIGAATRFWGINGALAVRQVSVFSAQDNSVFIRFDAEAVEEVEDEIPGSQPLTDEQNNGPTEQ